MDWLKNFTDRFSRFKEIQTLQADSFHGSITIHFSCGVPMNYELKMVRRAEVVESDLG